MVILVNVGQDKSAVWRGGPGSDYVHIHHVHKDYCSSIVHNQLEHETLRDTAHYPVRALLVLSWPSTPVHHSCYDQVDPHRTKYFGSDVDSRLP